MSVLERGLRDVRPCRAESGVEIDLIWLNPSQMWTSWGETGRRPEARFRQPFEAL